MVQDIKSEARSFGREIEVFTVGQIVCRPTQKEADDYYRYATIEMADWGSIDRMMQIKNLTPQTLGDKHACSVIHPVRVATADDSSAH